MKEMRDFPGRTVLSFMHKAEPVTSWRGANRLQRFSRRSWLVVASWTRTLSRERAERLRGGNEEIEMQKRMLALLYVASIQA